MDKFFTLYEMASLRSTVKKLFNLQHEIQYTIETKTVKFHFTVEGDFNPTDIAVSDVTATILSPAGEIIGHGMSILEAFNDAIRQVPQRS